MSFFELKDLIPKSAGRFQLQGELKAAMVINRASALVKELYPEEINRFIRVKKLSDKVLWIAVTNSSVSYSLQMKSFQLQKMINQSFGDLIIKNIRIIQEVAAPEEDYGE